jgi:hypothetical protein
MEEKTPLVLTKKFIGTLDPLDQLIVEWGVENGKIIIEDEPKIEE